MSIYNKEFFITFNKLSYEISTSLNNEQYDKFKNLSEQLDILITKHKYVEQIKKWSRIHQKFCPVITECLTDKFFQDKYSNISHHNYKLNDGSNLSFYNLLFIAHHCASENNHIKLIELADKISDINLNLNIKDRTLSLSTLKCNFYLYHLKTIFQQKKRLTCIIAECPICLDTKQCEIGHFKCTHDLCSDCYKLLNNKCCCLCRSTYISLYN